MILSVSQVTTFDRAQTGGCERKFWFERTQGLKQDETKQQDEGTAGHDLLAKYLSTGEAPQGRAKMGKAVRGAIVKGELPAPGPDLIVEQRFSGQEKYDVEGKWIPLDTSETFSLGGVPWDGFIDLAFRRGDVPEIWDHKFSSDPDQYALPASKLIKTVQMPVYVLSQMPYWPDAKAWRIVHHYVSKKGVHSFKRHALVTVDEVLEQETRIKGLVEKLKAVAAVPIDRQNDVPANTKSCDVYNGCPFQSVCSAFQARKTMSFQMTEEQKKLFTGLDTVATTENGATTSTDDPFDAEEIAALEAQLAAKKAAKPKERKLEIKDVGAPGLVPPPTPSPAVEPAPVCACGTQLSPDNASKLRDGKWKHISCLNDLPLVAAAPPAETPKPKERKKPAPMVKVDSAESETNSSPSTVSATPPPVTETKNVAVHIATADPVVALMTRQTAALEAIAKILGAAFNR